MRRSPGGVRKGREDMLGGEGSGEEEGFGVAGVLEVDFEGGEGMADGGKLMQVCNIYPIGFFLPCAALIPRPLEHFEKIFFPSMLAGREKKCVPRVPMREAADKPNVQDFQ